MTEKQGLTLRFVALEAAVADVAKDYAKESGIQVSQHLLTMAKTFQNADQFLAACKLEEEFLATDAGKAMVRDVYQKEGIKEDFTGNVPKSWTQAKSNIKRSWSAGINIKEYDTESKLRKALNAKRNANKPESKVSNTVEVLAKAIKMLPVDQQEKALEEVAKLTTKYYNAAQALLVNKTPKAKDKDKAPEAVAVAA